MKKRRSSFIPYMKRSDSLTTRLSKLPFWFSKWMDDISERERERPPIERGKKKPVCRVWRFFFGFGIWCFLRTPDCLRCRSRNESGLRLYYLPTQRFSPGKKKRKRWWLRRQSASLTRLLRGSNTDDKKKKKTHYGMLHIVVMCAPDSLIQKSCCRSTAFLFFCFKVGSIVHVRLSPWSAKSEEKKKKTEN